MPSLPLLLVPFKPDTDPELQEVLELVASQLHHFDAVNMSTAVTRMGKMQTAPGELAHAIQHASFARLKVAISAPQASARCSSSEQMKSCFA